MGQKSCYESLQHPNNNTVFTFNPYFIVKDNKNMILSIYSLFIIKYQYTIYHSDLPRIRLCKAEHMRIGDSANTHLISSGFGVIWSSRSDVYNSEEKCTISTSFGYIQKESHEIMTCYSS